MSSKGIFTLAAAAAALGFAAYFIDGGAKKRPAAILGEKLVGAFDIEKVAKIEIGDKVVLSAGEGGWVAESMQGYPADRRKIAENILKLQELKVGQVVPGKKIAEPLPVKLSDAEGNVLASLVLGERHEKWGFGRYAEYKGEAVLTGESLDAFGDDSMRWCETKIVDTPYVSFSALADASLDDAALGFATGAVVKVTISGDTNRTAVVGAAAPGGSGRYFRIEGEKWNYVVPSYSVDSLLPKPSAETASDPQTAVPAAEEPREEPAAETPASEAQTAVPAAEEPAAAPVAESPAAVPQAVEPAAEEPAAAPPAEQQAAKSGAV